MKRKPSSGYPRQQGIPTGAPCKLCNRYFTDPLSMLLHLVSEHPVQLAQHPAAQSILSKVQKSAYDFGVSFG